MYPFPKLSNYQHFAWSITNQIPDIIVFNLKTLLHTCLMLRYFKKT